MRVLIVSHANWHGPARFPKALKAAGWEVGILCKKGTLIDATRFWDWKDHFPVWQEVEVLRAILKAIRDFRPQLILPGEDPTVEAMMELRRMLEDGRIENIDEASVDAIRSSTFPPKAHRYVRSKIDLLEALRERGANVAPQRELATMADADTFVQEYGYPVLLKPDSGFAGIGIVLCRNEEELLGVLPGLMRTRQGRYAIQKHLGTETTMQEFTAKDGKILSRLTIYRVKTHPEPMGQTSVARVITNLKVNDTLDELADLLGYNGLCAAQFMTTDEGKGENWLIEANPRMSSFVHLGRLLGADHAAALLAAWKGERYAATKTREGVTIAFYPQESIRDPDSEYLQGLRDYVDDDPELDALLRSMIKG